MTEKLRFLFKNKTTKNIKSMILTNKSGQTIEISNFCWESNPCQHEIIKGETESTRNYGDKIFNYLRDNNYEIPKHFEIYNKDIIRETNVNYKYIQSIINTIKKSTLKIERISEEKINNQKLLRNFLNKLVFERYSNEFLLTHPHNKDNHYTEKKNIYLY